VVALAPHRLGRDFRSCKHGGAKGKAGKDFGGVPNCEGNQRQELQGGHEADPPACSPSSAFLDELSGF
jgi:hypothetical protein